MRPVLAGVVACSLLLATACGERGEPTGAAVQLYPVTVSGRGDRPVVLQRRPQRVAVVAPGPAAILRQLGAERVSRGSPLFDPTGRIHLRRLTQLHPDLIVASPSTDQVDLAQAARAARTPVYVAPESSIRDVKQAIADLGLLVDRPVAARQLIRAIEDRRRGVAARLGATPAVRVFIDTGFFTTVGDHSLIGDLVREAKGQNVAGPSPEQGPFDLRQLARLDPQVYLATSDAAVTLRDLRENPRTRNLSAVRAGRFGTIPAGLLEPGPRIGAGLEAVAKLLHPDAFR